MRGNLLSIMVILTVLLGAFVYPSYAFTPIPNKSGFSGFVKLGGGYIRGKTNMYAGTALGDIGKKEIDSLDDSPEAKSSGLPDFNFDLRYTFAGSRTQLLAGNRLEDILRYDFVAQVGVRQEIGNLGIAGISYVFTSFPTKVWKDPYVVNQNRKKTDRTAPGVRLTWENIFGTTLEMEYAYRKIDIDDERSGQTQLIPDGILTPSQANQLDREGDSHRGRAAYIFKFGEKHRISPALFFLYEDLDGDAMTNYTIDFQPTYAYIGSKFDLVLNVLIGYADYDKKNPVYGKTQEDKRFGAGAIGFWKNPFGWKPFGIERFRLYGQTSYFNANSNIDFYDTEILTATAGVWIGF